MNETIRLARICTLHATSSSPSLALFLPRGLSEFLCLLPSRFLLPPANQYRDVGVESLHSPNSLDFPSVLFLLSLPSSSSSSSSPFILFISLCLLSSLALYVYVCVCVCLVLFSFDFSICFTVSRVFFRWKCSFCIYYFFYSPSLHVSCYSFFAYLFTFEHLLLSFYFAFF